MDKWFIVCLVLVAIIGLGYSVETGLVDLGGEPIVTSSRKVDLTLTTETKTLLEDKVLETITTENCKTQELVCIEWDCLEVDEKTGECLKQGDKCLKEELQCTETEIIETSPVVTITPLPNGCYDIVSEPYLHRYNTCLPIGMTPEQFVENDLKNIATHLQEENSKVKSPVNETIEISIK